jgi:hypothetical protein
MGSCFLNDAASAQQLIKQTLVENTQLGLSE